MAGSFFDGDGVGLLVAVDGDGDIASAWLGAGADFPRPDTNAIVVGGCVSESGGGRDASGWEDVPDVALVAGGGEDSRSGVVASVDGVGVIEEDEAIGQGGGVNRGSARGGWGGCDGWSRGDGGRLGNGWSRRDGWGEGNGWRWCSGWGERGSGGGGEGRREGGGCGWGWRQGWDYRAEGGGTATAGDAEEDDREEDDEEDLEFGEAGEFEGLKVGRLGGLKVGRLGGLKVGRLGGLQGGEALKPGDDCFDGGAGAGEEFAGVHDWLEHLYVLCFLALCNVARYGFAYGVALTFREAVPRLCDVLQPGVGTRQPRGVVETGVIGGFSETFCHRAAEGAFAAHEQADCGYMDAEVFREGAERYQFAGSALVVQIVFEEEFGCCFLSHRYFHHSSF